MKDTHAAAGLDGQNRGEDNDILRDFRRVKLNLKLLGRVTGYPATIAHRGQIWTVSANKFLLGDRCLPFVIGIDPVREELTLGIIWDPKDIVIRGFSDVKGLVFTLRQWANKVWLSEVVPADDLD
ncbi:hypothetical protein PENCOP_c013G00708 [Penicillium coprophilum]|uniref:Uncharacterized protein n=1 Tax=Penicillium coprophilum TaxID=36646 RepID=A0A1V6UAH5_9EURO|nr:hypothetical protein PENCOP_c013G00708 [Penicillium coprophilum]